MISALTIKTTVIISGLVVVTNLTFMMLPDAHVCWLFYGVFWRPLINGAKTLTCDGMSTCTKAKGWSGSEFVFLILQQQQCQTSKFIATATADCLTDSSTTHSFPPLFSLLSCFLIIRTLSLSNCTQKQQSQDLPMHTRKMLAATEIEKREKW